MLNRHSQSPQKDSQTHKSLKSSSNLSSHHGLQQNHDNLLLDVPSETLTGITSFLNPPSLLALASVCSLLYNHVKDDNTWRRAFVYQFLGIAPESELNHDSRSLMLRRSEGSWKAEFITRYNLKRRWVRSRNTTITHTPVHSAISSMHLLPSNALLTTSLQYGIVARSLPLTGKIIRGFLDASNQGAGLGIGNPNAEFSPNVSACAIASDGGTARILWGFRSGEVAVTTAGKVMDSDRRAAKLLRCGVREQHDGTVVDAVWDDADGKGAAVTGGADGRVKMWDTKRVVCVWTSEQRQKTPLIVDGCIKVCSAIAKGWIAGAFKSGDIILWTGFDAELIDDVALLATDFVRPIQIACPVRTSTTGTESQLATPELSLLALDPHAEIPTILAAYKDEPFFYRIKIDTKNDNSIDHTTFGDATFGPISIVSPFFSSTSSFILTGDHLGCVSVYDWSSKALASRSVASAPLLPHSASNSLTPTLSIAPTSKFEAHEDGSSVTALCWTNTTLITGSSRGTTYVWDALTFEYLRSFASPVPKLRRHDRGHMPALFAGANANDGDGDRESVRQISINAERDMMVVSVGERVMAWRAGPVPKSGSGGLMKGKNSVTAKKRRNGNAKYLQQLEMHQTIAESQQQLELESRGVRRAYGREKEHRDLLEHLGLDEVEAVEYVLMLSRDEALQQSDPFPHGTPSTSLIHTQSSPPYTAGSHGMEEGVFEGDFDVHPDHASSRYPKRTRSLPSTPPPTAPSALTQIVPSPSNRKVQVSPRVRPEPTEAGFGDECAVFDLDVNVPAAVGMTTPRGVDGSAFPAMLERSGGESPRSVGAGSASSFGSVRSLSAWSTPLVKTPPRGGGVNGATHGRGRVEVDREEEMDDDLRFVIELSLVEARSRGEDV